MESEEDCKNATLITQALKYHIKHYIVPIQVTIGVSGNALTVLILNQCCLRSRTTVLLTFLTLADVACLLCHIPGSMATFRTWYTDENFRRFYYLTELPLLSVQNAFSCASIWLALSVTAERVLVISRPLRAQLPFNRIKMGLLVSTILILSFLIAGFNNFRSEMKPRNETIRCGSKNLSRFKMVPIANPSPAMKFYIEMSLLMSSFVIVLIPFVAMIVLNWILIHFLRSSRRTLSLVGRSHTGRLAEINERKIAIMVCVIITAFTLFNTPSAIITFMHLILKHSERARYYINMRTDVWKWGVYVSNCLVATGKTANFILYCLSSDHFRRRLKDSAIFCFTRSPTTSYLDTSRKKSYEIVGKSSPYVFKKIVVNMSSLPNTTILFNNNHNHSNSHNNHTNPSLLVNQHQQHMDNNNIHQNNNNHNPQTAHKTSLPPNLHHYHHYQVPIVNLKTKIQLTNSSLTSQRFSEEL